MPVDFKADFKSFADDPQFGIAISTLLHAVHEKENDLTREQFIDLIFQAIASGDFIRQIRLIYIPFAEQERLRSKIKELEAEMLAAREIASVTKEYCDHTMAFIIDANSKKPWIFIKQQLDVINDILTPAVTNVDT